MSSVKSESIKVNLTNSIKKELDAIEVKKEPENKYSEFTKIKPEIHAQYNPQPTAPSTILITNNYSQNDTSIGLTNKQSSITIVTRKDHTSDTMPTSSGGSTVVLDRINICINNHFNESRTSVQNRALKSDIIKEKSGPIMIESNSNVNNSNISNNNRELIKPEISGNGFIIGEDVLVQKKDGRYYLGTIVAIARNQSLVKFDDNTECWSSFEELTKFGVNEQNEGPMCVICKKTNNDIVEVCERCGRGYHRKCADGSFQKKGIWFCRRCTAPNGFKSKDNNELFNLYPESNKKIITRILHKTQLPYNLDSLTWDNYHRVNLEQIYCYCGKNGEWYNKMLQCCKCQQWFHEKCVSCLDYPMLAGDRFYVFACTMCNKGKEFLRRLELKWSDVVHLVLFNITLNNQRKYYHAIRSIVPYAIENWLMLQLKPSMRNLSSTKIRDNILKTLSASNGRFKCGKEIKKGHSFWGLRSRIPPPCPKLTIPFEVELSDHYLKEKKKLNIIPNKLIKTDENEFKDTNFENESSSTTSEDDIFQNKSDEIETKIDSNMKTNTKQKGKIYCRRLSNLIENKNSHLNGFDSNDLSDKSHDCNDFNDSKNDEHKVYDENDVEINVEETNTFKVLSSTKHKRKRTKSSLYASQRELPISNIDLNTCSDIIEISDSSDETSSRGTLDLIIPPPKNFIGRNNPFRLTPKKNDKNNKPINLNITNNQSGIKNISQTGTAGQFRIVRTVKRKLSAKDIMIGPNKEIKRRRLRRRSGNVEVISTATSLQSLPKSAAFLPIRTDSKNIHLSVIRSSLNLATSCTSQSTSTPKTITNTASISNVLNGRRLRQRNGKNYAENLKRNSFSSLNINNTNNLNNSNNSSNSSQINVSSSLNNSNQSNVSLSELKTSVNMYFGGINRILNGENFMVRAKRLTPDGKVQYLIEWEGVS